MLQYTLLASSTKELVFDIFIFVIRQRAARLSTLIAHHHCPKVEEMLNFPSSYTPSLSLSLSQMPLVTHACTIAAVGPSDVPLRADLPGRQRRGAAKGQGVHLVFRALQGAPDQVQPGPGNYPLYRR